MYETSIYFMTFNVWRWEIRCDGKLLRCGTAPTQPAAEIEANQFLNTERSRHYG